jgi:hypothetical protein
MDQYEHDTNEHPDSGKPVDGCEWCVLRAARRKGFLSFGLGESTTPMPAKKGED